MWCVVTLVARGPLKQCLTDVLAAGDGAALGKCVRYVLPVRRRDDPSDTRISSRFYADLLHNSPVKLTWKMVRNYHRSSALCGPTSRLDCRHLWSDLDSNAQRLQICLDTAKGLNYLHHIPVIHRGNLLVFFFSHANSFLTVTCPRRFEVSKPPA